MTILEFEQKVLEIEDIVIYIRASKGTEVLDYPYTDSYPDQMDIKSLLNNRIYPLLNGLEVSVINGNCTNPHPRTSLGKLRNTYS